MTSKEQTFYEALRDGQRQLDADGVEVGVSRQALDEALAEIDRLRHDVSRSMANHVAHINAVETTVRTDHAENLAKAAEAYVNAAARMDTDGSAVGVWDDAMDTWRAFKRALHEYRKRSQAKAPAPPFCVNCGNTELVEGRCDECNEKRFPVKTSPPLTADPARIDAEQFREYPMCDVRCFDYPKCECVRRMP
jgi:hypothetical protein